MKVTRPEDKKLNDDDVRFYVEQFESALSKLDGGASVYNLKIDYPLNDGQIEAIEKIYMEAGWYASCRSPLEDRSCTILGLTAK